MFLRASDIYQVKYIIMCVYTYRKVCLCDRNKVYTPLMCFNFLKTIVVLVQLSDICCFLDNRKISQNQLCETALNKTESSSSFEATVCDVHCFLQTH